MIVCLNPIKKKKKDQRQILTIYSSMSILAPLNMMEFRSFQMNHIVQCHSRAQTFFLSGSANSQWLENCSSIEKLPYFFFKNMITLIDVYRRSLLNHLSFRKQSPQTNFKFQLYLTHELRFQNYEIITGHRSSSSSRRAILSVPFCIIWYATTNF